MYQLYYYPLNASMAPHFVLEAIGQEYELLLVDRKSEAQKSPEYLKLNPAGRIPTLVEGETVIFESPAICVHLAEQHPESQLIPALGDKNRPKFFQWLMYLTNTLQSELMIYFYPSRHIAEGTDPAQVIAQQEKRLADIWSLLDKELETQTYLVGEHITVCDYFLFMLAVWSDELQKPPLSFTNVNRYLKHMATLPAVIKVCEKENLCLTDY